MPDRDHNIFDPHWAPAPAAGHSASGDAVREAASQAVAAPGLFEDPAGEPLPDASLDVQFPPPDPGFATAGRDEPAREFSAPARRITPAITIPPWLKKLGISLACALIAFLLASAIAGRLHHRSPQPTTSASTAGGPRAASVQPPAARPTPARPRKARETQRSRSRNPRKRRPPRTPAPKPAAPSSSRDTGDGPDMTPALSPPQPPAPAPSTPLPAPAATSPAPAYSPPAQPDSSAEFSFER